MKKTLFVLCLSVSIMCVNAENVLGSSTDLTVNPTSGKMSNDTLSVKEWTKGVSSTININSVNAMAYPAYLVTPGDVYTLSLIDGSNSSVYTIVVDNTYKMRIASVAVIDVYGKTYTEVKNQVEAIMAKNFPMKGSQFLLTSPATFKILIKGEVIQTTEVNAWGLSKLSVTIASVITDYSSIRNVAVVSRDAKTKYYDLFKALRFGDLSQDPLLRPGDSIILSRAQKTVTLTGAVERPGVYQMLEGENINDLIYSYGSGLTPLADMTKIELVRQKSSASPNGLKKVISSDELQHGYGLVDYDSVTVGKTTDLLPSMFIEGSVGAVAGSSTQASVRLVVQYNPGENLANVVRSKKASFSAISDLSNAYIVRGKKTIPVDLSVMLYDSSFMSELVVEENDLLVVPFKQYFVSVIGNVVSPGRFPYIPNRTWDYYVGLAGGIVKETNMGKWVTITDVMGKRLKKTDTIMPETTIEAAKNSWYYYFNLYSPVILTTCTLITTYYATKLVLEQNN